MEHLIEFAKSHQAKRIRQKAVKKETKQRKEKLKSKSDYQREAQAAFNAYIRERDKDKGCISCGCSLWSEVIGGGYDAGHYRSRGSAPHLAFHPLNCHGQCKRCNRYLSGNVTEYRKGLIARYGEKVVESIESDQTLRHLTVEKLIRIKHLYERKKKLRKVLTR